MDLSKQNNIIITDIDYLPFLYQYKNNHPDLEIKFMSKDEVLAKLVFSFNYDEAIKHLIKRGVEYSKAKRYLKLFQVINDPKSVPCYEYVKDDIVTNPIGPLFFKNKQILLFELNEDKELKNVLLRNNLKYQDLSFEDLGFTCVSSYQKPNLLYFDNKFNQYFYIFADIRKRLLLDQSLVNKINILVNDEYDLFYVRFVAKLFKIETYINYRRPLYTIPIVKNKLKNMFNHPNRGLVFSDDALKYPELQLLKNIVDKYELDKLDFVHGYANLLEIVQQTTFTSNLDNKGIVITSAFTLSPSNYTYITNFQYDTFYKIYKDDNVLTDLELIKLGANPSYVNSLLDKRKKTNYLRYQNTLLISRVKQHLNDNIYDASLLSEFKSKEIKMANLYHEDGVYTDTSKHLYNINELDKRFLNRKIDVYNSYDHSFKPFDTSELFKDRKKYSITDLEQFVNCPFRYYLQKLLPVSDEDKYYAYLGTLFHKILETVNHNDFDFERAFEDGVEAFKAQKAHEHKPFTKKDEALLEIVHYWFKQLIEIFLSNIKAMRDKGTLIEEKDDHEFKVEFTLNDGKDTYPFSGKVDKILYTKKNNSYYTIIDYKSGKEAFDPSIVFLGRDVQLPLYYEAIKNDTARTKGFTFGGFMIEHNYSSSFSHILIDKTKSVVSQSTYQKFIRLNGLSNRNIDYWHSIDDDKKSYKKNGEVNGSPIYVVNKHSFTSEDADESIIDKFKGKYNLADLIQDAKNSLINIIHDIRNNNFAIKPSVYGQEIAKPINEKSRLMCVYCSYQNICYHKRSDAHDYSEDIEEHFSKFMDKEKEEEHV